MNNGDSDEGVKSNIATLDPQTKNAKVTRPGISPATLQATGVRHVSATEAKKFCSIDTAGLWIPFRDILGNPIVDQEREYGRLRLDTPRGDQKYHQRAGTGVHAYVPPGLNGMEGDRLILVEGEFKSIALVEAGFAAVGISGFYGWGRKSDSGDYHLVDELRTVIGRFNPTRIYFVGDMDTALNFAFFHAAAALAKTLGTSVFLPRIPFSAPAKGVDDIREAIPDGFRELFQGLVDDAVEVTPKSSPGAVAVAILNHHKTDLEAGRFGALSSERAEKRLLEIASILKAMEPISFARISKMIANMLAIGKGELTEALKQIPAVSEEAADEMVSRFVFDGRYYWKKKDVIYQNWSREDVLLDLEAAGFSRQRSGGIAPAEIILHRIQEQRRVDYAGLLCGRPAGFRVESARQILVTRGPEIPVGDESVDAAPLMKFFGDFLGVKRDAEGETQFELFLGWLRFAREAINNNADHLPGQLLGLFGPQDCGKSLTQSLITQILGGREAECSGWMRGNEFNGGMWEAEHLYLSDSDLDEDPRQRKLFRDRIKQIVANPTFPFHRKHREAFTMRPIWRVTLSANLDPQSANVIPSPMADPSLSDKIIYLRCYSPPEPFHGPDPDSRREFWDRLISAIPGFVALVDDFVVSTEHRKGRFQITEYVHPDVMEVLEARNPDREVAEMLDDFLNQNGPLDGRILDVFNELDRFTKQGIRRAAKNSQVLGHTLRRLRDHPDWKGRIETTTEWDDNRNKKTIWRIRRLS